MKSEHLVSGVVIAAQTFEYLLNCALQRVMEENMVARADHDIATSVVTERVHSYLSALSDSLGDFLNNIDILKSVISASDMEIIKSFNDV